MLKRVIHKEERGCGMPPLVCSVKAIMPSGRIVQIKRFESHRKASIFISDSKGRELQARFGFKLYVSKDAPDGFDHLDILKEEKV